VRLRKKGLTRDCDEVSCNSRSFKWTVQIREIVSGQFFCYCRGSQSKQSSGGTHIRRWPLHTYSTDAALKDTNTKTPCTPIDNANFTKNATFMHGTVDFIFGNAAVVFQNCMIYYARNPMIGQQNTVTAQGRTDPNQNTWISILNSRVMAAPDLVPRLSSMKTYLGRPWKLYSRPIFLQSFLDTLVDPAG